MLWHDLSLFENPALSYITDCCRVREVVFIFWYFIDTVFRSVCIVCSLISGFVLVKT